MQIMSCTPGRLGPGGLGWGPEMYMLNKHSRFLAWVAPGPPFENHYLRPAFLFLRWPNSTLSLST